MMNSKVQDTFTVTPLSRRRAARARRAAKRRLAAGIAIAVALIGGIMLGLAIQNAQAEQNEKTFREPTVIYRSQGPAEVVRLSYVPPADPLPDDSPATANYEIPETLVIGGAEFSATNDNSARYENVKKFFMFWDEKGLSREGICGLAGNWFTEYSLFVSPDDGSSHFGMFQIGKTYAGEPSELYSLYCNQYVDRNTLEVQCQFVHDVITGKWDEEITTNYGHIWEEMANASTAAEAAEVFAADFEKGGHTQKRMDHAEEIFGQTDLVDAAPEL
jgi:hypothetical protein